MLPTKEQEDLRAALLDNFGLGPRNCKFCGVLFSVPPYMECVTWNACGKCSEEKFTEWAQTEEGKKAIEEALVALKNPVPDNVVEKNIINRKRRNQSAFVSGHLDLTQAEFDEHYRHKIYEALVDYNDLIVVGDSRGADFMAQQYVRDLGYVERLRVFHMFVQPRNIVDGATVLACGFETDEARDNSMTLHSHYDIAWVREGRENSGTAKNIKRREEKKNKNP